MKRLVLALGAMGLVAGGVYVLFGGGHAPAPSTPSVSSAADTAPAVSVVKVATSAFVETVLVTGSIVARDEIMIAPEVEGLRVVELLADEGDYVKKDQVLARLSRDALEAQLAQNAANIARAAAAIAVAESGIVQAEAAVREAANAFDRAKPLKDNGYLSGATFDQREAAAATAKAKLGAARDSLTSAKADKAAYEAQRREIEWRLSRTEVRAPVEGRISRRTAREGAVASAVNEALFRIVARGEVELDAEVAEADVSKVRPGQDAAIQVTGIGEVKGTVRLVSGEVDKATRLAKVRLFLGADTRIKIGAFGRGTIETARGTGLAVPTAAVVFGPDGPTVQVVNGDKVETRAVKSGLKTQQMVEIRDGVREGETVVARSGSFLRDGDVVRPVVAGAKVSEAGR